MFNRFADFASDERAKTEEEEKDQQQKDREVKGRTRTRAIMPGAARSENRRDQL
jgi:hypothetical protein